MADSNKWQDLRQRARSFDKIALESSNFYLPHFFKFTNLNDSQKVYFLGVLNGQTHFTLLYADFPGSDDAQKRLDNMIWKRCWSADAYLKSSKPLNREQELLRERMRVRTSGIMSYSLTEHFDAIQACKFTQLVYLSGSQLHVFRDNGKNESLPQELSTTSDGCILNPTTCPCNPDLICFVQDGDLRVKHGMMQEEQLTHLRDASSQTGNCFSAGMPSYVVQEEFDRYVGYWWRPNENQDTCKYQILYEEVDESHVNVLEIVSYSSPESTVDQYRYPRPGTRNALSDLKIVEFTINDGRIVDIQHLCLEKPLHALFADMEYLLNAGWLPDGTSIYVEMTDRLQTIKKLFMIPLEKFSVSIQPGSAEPMETNELKKPYYLLREETSDFWIHTNELLHFLPSDNPKVLSFLTGSESPGFLHIHHFTVDFSKTTPCSQYDGLHLPRTRTETALTSGEWEVAGRQIWVNGDEKLIYFMGYKDTPLESHLYVTSFDQPQTIKDPIRLTIPGYSHSVEMDKNCRFFVTTYSSVSRPHACEVYSISVTSNFDKFLIKAEKIGTLLTPVVNKSLTTAEIFEFGSSCGSIFYGLVFPPDPAELPPTNKFPVILNVYGGPHVQHVTNSYTVNRHLVSHKLAHFGYAVVIIDGRGSARRGVKFEGHLKKKLGTVELDDQVETLQWLGRKFDSLDLNRVGIMGWSYGGYLSLMGIACRPDIFKVAISGAPVTSWHLYDTAYTERFLGLPSADPEVYKKSSIVELASKFPDEEGRVLIIHGLMDENVHFYHTSALVDALIKASKPYVLQAYPKERHGIRSHESHDHYITVLLSFLFKNLGSCQSDEDGGATKA